MFDTHKQHKSLIQAGFSDPQAQAITDVFVSVLGVVATKADLKLLETKFDGKFDSVDKRFDDIHKTLNRMNSLIIGHISATVGGIGIIVGAMFAVIAPHIR